MADPWNALSVVTQNVNADYLAGEPEHVRALLGGLVVDPGRQQAIQTTARSLVEAVKTRPPRGGITAFLTEYDLSSQEGVALMCLAEALLRIPDADTADAFIADRLGAGRWEEHLGESDSLFVNASTWALMLTGSMIRIPASAVRHPERFLSDLTARLGEPVIRTALKTAMGIIAEQFVMGRDIQAAVARSRDRDNRRYRFSFDMLGEAALTTADAERYHTAYEAAIRAVGASSEASMVAADRPGVSVKLSALSPRFEYLQRRRAVPELAERLRALARIARDCGVALTVDAEESDRLEMTLAVFESVYTASEFSDWTGLGLAVQAYQKRAPAVLRWLQELAAGHRRQIPVRLVKGAYWDTEIKRAHEQGLRDFPVFTRKSSTDLSYLYCASYMLKRGTDLYPQFATHNAHTIAFVYHHADKRDFEFQRLHGMGDDLYEEELRTLGIPCRVYAPVGAHRDLLPYLVRRLLENGANTSFVNQLTDDAQDIQSLIADPIEATRALGGELRHPRIPLPADLYLPARVNSRGINFADAGELDSLRASLRRFAQGAWQARPLVDGSAHAGTSRPVLNPAHRDHRVGTVEDADEETARRALDVASQAWCEWDATAPDTRAQTLERAADRFEEHHDELAALCVLEAGKTLRDAHGDVREAVDFLRYYANECRRLFGDPGALPGPAGESNQLRLLGRGVFCCISPWNFPVAIFTGQVAAALAAGNSVIAKPAEQTSLAGARIVELLHEAGVPAPVLGFLPGDGARLGEVLLSDARVAGVAFTGSTATARVINRRLSQRDAPLATLIAETGGQNVMLVDSSALPEQVVRDVVHSAFNSAGQRCSALRVLYIQEEIAPRVLEMLCGHMAELTLGDPADPATDVGPVIDRDAWSGIERHLEQFAESGDLMCRAESPPGELNGLFVRPAVVNIQSIGQLEGEVFGPVLHVVRYRGDELDRVIADINACGYGLTLGIQTRIERKAEAIRRRMRVGNVYVNRNMIGAVVGSQPFGGMGLSGSGPKAGGPHYLSRFATEQACTINTAAIGGNASLLAGG